MDKREAGLVHFGRMRDAGLIAGVLALAGVAHAGEWSQAVRQRAVNFSRPGWFVVNGRFARPQATLDENDLFALLPTGDRLGLFACPNSGAEALLRGGRTALVTLRTDGVVDAAAWTLACTGRTWNDTRSAGTQHLQLNAVDGPPPDDDGRPRLVRVDVSPAQQVVEARMTDNDADGRRETAVVLVFGRDFVEAAIGPNPARPDLMLRGSDWRRLLAERPSGMRKYVLPVLRRLDHGRNPIAPGAADVYRAFPDLPTDPAAVRAVTATLTDLASPDPAVRQRATDALRATGPRGVQALMRVDPAGLSPEAADREAAVVAGASYDRRTAEQLREDPGFLLDCLADADANVRAAAGRCVTENAGSGTR